ncbi:MAG: hypothetical protein AAGJ83_07240, partial [Planctomycetota bacterium]
MENLEPVYLIATDEAGYGPKLGPLVITASIWRLPRSVDSKDPTALQACFSKLIEPIEIERSVLSVDDSKVVFKPRSRRNQHHDAGEYPAYFTLERATAAGLRWLHPTTASMGVQAILQPEDINEIGERRWLQGLLESQIGLEVADPVVSHWNVGDAKLMGIKSRIITASKFNAICETGLNKSDLLSSVTLDLVRRALAVLPDDGAECIVRCDRHGGRRYYSGPLQSVFPESLPMILEENSRESLYRVEEGRFRFQIAFTVKGDRFAPVAFSSMV